MLVSLVENNKIVLKSEKRKRQSMSALVVSGKIEEKEECFLTDDEENLDPNSRRLRSAKKQKSTQPTVSENPDGKDFYKLKTPRKGQLIRKLMNEKFIEEEEEEESSDEEKGYFHSLCLNNTSDHTLARLPVLDAKEMYDLLRDNPCQSHLEQTSELGEMHSRLFDQWRVELISGFNLCCYGFGSKKTLLEKFAQEKLNDHPLVVVNGYVPTLSLKEVMSSVAGAVGFEETHLNPKDMAIALVNWLEAQVLQVEKQRQKIYLLIHSIDGLRNEKSQSTLALLASSPFIHLICSIDHINAPLMWDSVKLSQFNWIYHDTTTFEPYTHETAYEDSLILKNKELSLNGMKHVLASLTSNTKGIFKLLAQHQIEHEEPWSYPMFFSACRDEFLVHNDLTFRTQLTEFKDHCMIVVKKDQGTDGFHIPLGKVLLEQLVQEIE